MSIACLDLANHAIDMHLWSQAVQTEANCTLHMPSNHSPHTHPCILWVKRVLCVHQAGHSARFLHLSDAMQSDCCLSRALWAEDLRRRAVEWGVEPHQTLVKSTCCVCVYDDAKVRGTLTSTMRPLGMPPPSAASNTRLPLLNVSLRCYNQEARECVYCKG